MNAGLSCCRPDDQSNSFRRHVSGRQLIERVRTGLAWEPRPVRSCGLLLLLVVGLGGCQASWSFDRPAGLIDHAEFKNVWKTYGHCRSSSDPDEIQVDARYLDRAAYVMESKSPSPLVLPRVMQHLVSKLPSRLAVDLQAMALDCALHGGQVARAAGRIQMAEELFTVVVARGDEEAYGYYVLEAGRGLEHLESVTHVAKETHTWAPGSFEAQAWDGQGDRVALVRRRHQRGLAQIAWVSRLRQPGGFYRNKPLRSESREDAVRMVQTSVTPLDSLAAPCPASAVVKQYDISVIKVEIVLHWWLSFSSPGYMYVLTENIDKVREEEAKNRGAGRMETHGPEAGTNGPHDRWIQPLAIRGHQGDCVKISFRNQLERGEAVGLHIDDASMVVHATGRLATMTNSDAMAAPGESIDLEWYIHPSIQEGGRQFHAYSHDRELAVMGPLGTFLVEPKRAVSLDPLGSGEETAFKGDANISRHDSQEQRK